VPGIDALSRAPKSSSIAGVWVFLPEVITVPVRLEHSPPVAPGG
jgi:hypothetical protein